MKTKSPNDKTSSSRGKYPKHNPAFAYRLFGEAYFKKCEKAKAVASIDKAIAIIQKLKELNALKEADKNLTEELEKVKTRYSRCNFDE